MELKDDLKNQSIWQKINFSNYQIPIAIGHPLINNIPIASYRHGNTEIGLDFTNSDNDSVFSFKILNSRSFEPFDVDGKFFQLGVIKELIGQYSSKKIWEDLGSLNLKKMESSFIDFMMNIKQGYHDLVYRIYLLNLRSKYFETEKNYTYINSLNYSVELFSKKGRNYEIISTFNNGEIYRIEISYPTWAAESKPLRERFYNNLKFEKIVEDKSLNLYGEFRTLPINKRFSNIGFTYLFSAYSLTIEDPKYLKEAIKVLERTQTSGQELKRLYNYATEKFGESLSAKGVFDESNAGNNKLIHEKAKIEEKEELDKYESDTINSDYYENDEEKIDEHLKNSDESGFKEDDDIQF